MLGPPICVGKVLGCCKSGCTIPKGAVVFNNPEDSEPEFLLIFLKISIIAALWYSQSFAPVYFSLSAKKQGFEDLGCWG